MKSRLTAKFASDAGLPGMILTIYCEKKKIYSEDGKSWICDQRPSDFEPQKTVGIFPVTGRLYFDSSGFLGEGVIDV
jgi:hypothetical protein